MSQSATDYRKRLADEEAEDAEERLLIQKHVPIETLSLVAQAARNFVRKLVSSETKLPSGMLLPFCELSNAAVALQDRLLDLNVEQERIEAENARQAEGERVAQMLNDAQAEGY